MKTYSFTTLNEFIILRQADFPYSKGKLRLIYECNPIAFLAEQAGGKASDGKQRILDIKPESLHQRILFYTGSLEMVKKVEEFLE